MGLGQSHPVARGPLTVHKRVDMTEVPIESVDDESIESVSRYIDSRVRDVKLANARFAVLRDAVGTCYKQYGPNHPIKCRPIYIEYLKHLEGVSETRVNIPELHPELADQPITA